VARGMLVERAAVGAVHAVVEGRVCAAWSPGYDVMRVTGACPCFGQRVTGRNSPAALWKPATDITTG